MVLCVFVFFAFLLPFFCRGGYLFDRFGDATQVAYSFWLYDLCDTYLELIKPVVGDLSEGNKKVRRARRRRTVSTFALVWFGCFLCTPTMSGG